MKDVEEQYLPNVVQRVCLQISPCMFMALRWNMLSKVLTSTVLHA